MVSLIVGDGSTFPLCMQHQVTNLVAVPPNGPPFLLGAAVEGPNSAATKGSVTNMVACPPNGVDQFAAFNGNGSVYKDNVQSFDTVEPAIDLTASSFLGFAWEIAGSAFGDALVNSFIARGATQELLLSLFLQLPYRL